MGAIGLAMLSSRLSAACGSFMTKYTAVERAMSWMRSSTADGVDLVVDGVEDEHDVERRVDRRAEPRRRPRSARWSRPAPPASARARAIAPSSRSYPTNVDAGNARAMSDERVSGAARDVGDARARLELLDEPRGEREISVDEQRVVEYRGRWRPSRR